MKKNKFLALTMLCSAFCGMPTKAQEIKASVPKKFIKNKKKLEVKGANSYSSGESFESKDLKKRSNNGFSDFVNLVIDHPISSFMIGGGLVLMEEGIRRKLHSKQETALVIYKNKSIVGEKYAAFVHKNKLTEDFVINTFFPFMDDLIYNKNFQDDILMEFFELPCLSARDEYSAQVKGKRTGRRDVLEKAFLKFEEYEKCPSYSYSTSKGFVKNKFPSFKGYFMKRKFNFKGCDILKCLIRYKYYEQENFGKIKSHIETLNQFDVKPNFVVYLKYVGDDSVDFCVDVIVGKQKTTGKILRFKIWW